VKEPPPPPFFDQWLACLKFIAGWNDQRKYSAREVKEAFSEHLAAEAIIGKKTVDQLCRTIVPLLMDLESVDATVVANLRKEVLKTLKIVQVCVLRIVTFELIREQAAKVALKKKAKGGKAPQVPADGATYLASDISSLAKVVGHFRFEPVFTKGLHQLILSIRRQKQTGPPKVEKGSKKQAGAKQKKEAMAEPPAEEVPKAADTKKEGHEGADGGVQSSPNTQASQGKKDSKENADSAAADGGGGSQEQQEPPKKKPRMVS